MKPSVLFLFVVATAILLGGGLYETLVVMPLWTANVPETVIGFYQHNVANPQYAMNPGGRFWIIIMPIVGLLSIATLLTSFGTRPDHRRWRTVGSGLALAAVIFTFAYFIPNIIKLSSEAVMTMQQQDVASLAISWERLNWLRAILFAIALFASLRAMMLPSSNNLKGKNPAG
jgi:hypothetical protein